MADLTNWGETYVRGVVFEDTAKLTTLYLALLSAVADSETASVTEIDVAGYARKAITPGTDFDAGTNGSDIVFATPTATDDVDATHLAIYDAATAGNCIMIMALTSAIRLNDGGEVKIPGTSLTITFD